MGSNFKGLRPVSEGAVTWERVDAEQRKPGFCNSLVQGNFRKCYLEVAHAHRPVNHFCRPHRGRLQTPFL